MYLKHFHLKSKPFLITPETESFFTGGSRKILLASLLQVLRHDEGIFKVTGEVGSGKTTACRFLLKMLPRDKYKTVYIADPTLTRDQVMYALAEGLGLTVSRDQTEALVVSLQKRLARLHERRRRVVLLIDEAHAMPIETLEQLRLLSQVEASGSKIMHIVLFGPEELDHNLALPELRAVRDRITQSFRLQKLKLGDIAEYLEFKMRAAGYEGPPAFTQPAIRIIARMTRGLPRRINVLADKSLLAAALDGKFEVETRHVKLAVHEIKLGRGDADRFDWQLGLKAFAAGAACTAMLMMLALNLGWIGAHDSRAHNDPAAVAGTPSANPATGTIRNMPRPEKRRAIPGAVDERGRPYGSQD